MHRFAVVVSLATLVLLFAGGLVTTTRSGDANPAWPWFSGVWKKGPIIEDGHRLVAGTVGLLTLVLAIWLQRREERRWVRALGWSAFACVVIQAVLGGLRVLVNSQESVQRAVGLEYWVIAIVHACVAPLFFCLTVALAVVTSPRWKGESREVPERLAGLATVTTLLMFAQLVIGAVMRHRGAGLAMPTFPLPLVPDFWSTNTIIHFAHRVMAVVIAVHVVMVFARALRFYPGVSIAMLGLLAAQVTLGALTILSERATLPTTLHVMVGAALLGASLMLTLQVRRERTLVLSRVAA